MFGDTIGGTLQSECTDAAQRVDRRITGPVGARPRSHRSFGKGSGRVAGLLRRSRTRWSRERDGIRPRTRAAKWARSRSARRSQPLDRSARLGSRWARSAAMPTRRAGSPARGWRSTRRTARARGARRPPRPGPAHRCSTSGRRAPRAGSPRARGPFGSRNWCGSGTRARRCPSRGRTGRKVFRRPSRWRGRTARRRRSRAPRRAPRTRGSGPSDRRGSSRSGVFAARPAEPVV